MVAEDGEAGAGMRGQLEATAAPARVRLHLEPVVRLLSATIVLAYVACSFFVFLAGVMLMAQIGVGDPAQGIEYTLWSVTAVVLGGASLFGARGSFIGTLLGALLIQQILNATVFLRLDQEWQFWLLGLLTLVAAGIYSQARRVRDAT